MSSNANINRRWMIALLRKNKIEFADRQEDWVNPVHLTINGLSDEEIQNELTRLLLNAQQDLIEDGCKLSDIRATNLEIGCPRGSDRKMVFVSLSAPLEYEQILRVLHKRYMQ